MTPFYDFDDLKIMCFDNENSEPAPKAPEKDNAFRVINVAINKDAYNNIQDEHMRTINVHIKKEKPSGHISSEDEDLRIVNVDIKKSYGLAPL